MATLKRRPNDPPKPRKRPDGLAALIAAWDGKLEASGFQDCESRDTRHLRNDGGASRHRTKSIEERAAYLDACRDYQRAQGHGRRFQQRDRPIWSLHVKGYSDQEIADRLGYSKSWIDLRVRYVRKRMLTWRKRTGRPNLLGLGRDSPIIALRLTHDLAAAVNDTADREHTTVSAAVRQFLTLGVYAYRKARDEALRSCVPVEPMRQAG